MMQNKKSSFKFTLKLILLIPFIVWMTASFVISQDFRDGNLRANPHLIKMMFPKISGHWQSNKAILFDNDLYAEIGNLSLQIFIDQDLSVSGKLGDAELKNLTLEIADYGLKLLADLDGKIKNDHPLKKQYVIVLMSVSEENQNIMNANFHLCNNLVWDKYLRVGGVNLSKSQ